MLAKTLGDVIFLSSRIVRLACPCGYFSPLMFSRSFHSSYNNRLPTKDDRKEELDQPIQFSGSKASSWNASDGIYRKRDIPTHQPIIISISLAVFLTYFLFLREENDLDVELNRSLFERVPGLEEQQIELALKYNRGSPEITLQLEKRLAEILEEKEKANNTPDN